MKKMLVLMCFVCLVFATVSTGQEVVTDDFSDGDWTNNPAWAVDSGTSPAISSGALAFPQSTKMRLSMPGSLDNTSCEISFDLFHINNVWANGNYVFRFEFKDMTQSTPYGKGYYLYCLILF